MEHLLTRRHFMQASGGATMAALLGAEPRQIRAESTPKIEARADTLILLWMAGGMAQTETFDPKRYTPFERGMESARVLSTFPSIDTVVDNIKLSQGLERIANVMDRGTLIRTHRVGDLGLFCTPAISTTGTPDMRRRRAWPPRTWAP